MPCPSSVLCFLTSSTQTNKPRLKIVLVPRSAEGHCECLRFCVWASVYASVQPFIIEYSRFVCKPNRIISLTAGNLIEDTTKDIFNDDLLKFVKLSLIIISHKSHNPSSIEAKSKLAVETL